MYPDPGMVQLTDSMFLPVSGAPVVNAQYINPAETTVLVAKDRDRHLRFHGSLYGVCSRQGITQARLRTVPAPTSALPTVVTHSLGLPEWVAHFGR